MDGSATLTMVMSRTIISMPVHSTTRAIQRLRSRTGVLLSSPISFTRKDGTGKAESSEPAAFPAGNCPAPALARSIGGDTILSPTCGGTVTRIDVKDLTSRYVAAWNEPDPARRRQAIRELWFAFRPRDHAGALRNVVKFGWELVPAGGGEAAATGLEILILGPDGRIEADYQFIEA